MTFRFLGCALILLCGCADFQRGPAAADGGAAPLRDSGGGATLSFASDIAPLLASCKTCHRTGGAAGDTALLLTGEAANDLKQLTAFLDLSAPASSRLLLKASGHSHGGGVVFAENSTEFQTLLAWVTDGANP